MGRCGCSSSGASGAAIANTDCMSVSGAGTVSSPFELEPIIDPDGTNLLECGPQGLIAPDPDNPGDWTSYEVTWASSGTPQPTAVDGYLLGWYRKRGKTVELQIQLVIPNGTGLGNGIYSFSLPPGLTPVAITPFPAIIGAANAGLQYPAVGIATPGGSTIGNIAAATTAASPFYVGEPAPGGLGWGPNSYIGITGLYQTN